jgi:thioesterase domain-containing protein
VSVAAFLSELRSRDIQVSAVGGELRCNARPGALTPELRDELRRRKSEILEFLASAQALAGAQRAIVPLQPNGERAPVFGVPGHNGDVFCYRALAKSVGPDQPLYGLQPPGLDGQGEPLTRVEDLAAYFASQIRAFQPNGPCIIAGYCAGGTVAFELAQQLTRGGAAIGFLALFGSPHPAFFRLSSQLRLRVAHQAERITQHAQALASQSWAARRGYLAAKLQERKARRNADPAVAVDPVLAQRARVESATLAAVRRYTPTHFAGRVELFLPGRRELPNSVAALRWRDLAQQFEVYFGPENCDGYTMLLEPTAPAFAELFRRSRDSTPKGSACADEPRPATNSASSLTPA